MRFIALLLTLSNILLLLWYLWRPEVVDGLQQKRSFMRLPSVPTIELFRISSEAQDLPVAAPNVNLASPRRVQSDQEKVSSEKSLPLLGGHDADCISVGVFAQEVVADLFVEVAEKNGLRSELRRVEQESSPRYWVFIPAFPARSDALVVLKDLQRRKIDSFILAEGELKNAISLGVFITESSAFVLQQQLLKKGVRSDIRRMARRSASYRVILRGSGITDQVDLIISKSEHQTFPKEIRKEPCSEVATTKLSE